jgi:hypothetical protein
MLAHLNTPGSSFKLLPYIQGITVVLLLICSGALYLGIAAVHMYVMIFLGLGLLGSITFVASEYDKVVKADKEKELGKAQEPGEERKGGASDKKTD